MLHVNILHISYMLHQYITYDYFTYFICYTNILHKTDLHDTCVQMIDKSHVNASLHGGPHVQIRVFLFCQVEQSALGFWAVGLLLGVGPRGVNLFSEAYLADAVIAPVSNKEIAVRIESDALGMI